MFTRGLIGDSDWYRMVFNNGLEKEAKGAFKFSNIEVSDTPEQFEVLYLHLNCSSSPSYVGAHRFWSI